MEEARSSFSKITRLGLVEGNFNEDSVSEESELTIDTSSSASSLVNEDKINKICLTFSHTESPSHREKIKAFWKYVDSRPDLKDMMVVGWNEQQLMEQREAVLKRNGDLYLAEKGEFNSDDTFKLRGSQSGSRVEQSYLKRNLSKVQESTSSSLLAYVPKTLKARAFTQTGEDKAVPELSKSNSTTS